MISEINKNVLGISEEEWKSLIQSRKCFLEMENERELQKDMTYVHRSILAYVFPIRVLKSQYKREGYEEGAKHYFFRGYMKGRQETLGLRTIGGTELSKKILKLLAVMGISFSYHDKFNGMFFSQPKYDAIKKQQAIYEIDKEGELKIKTSDIEERIVSILDKAEKEIQQLLTQIQ